MTKLRDLPTFVKLGDGESTIVTIDPSAEVRDQPGSMGGITYLIPATGPNGEKLIVRGGERLKDAIKDAIGTATGPVLLELSAQGRVRTTDRQYTAKRV